MERKRTAVLLGILIMLLSGCGNSMVVNKLKVSDISGYYILDSGEAGRALRLDKINKLQYAMVPYTAVIQENNIVWKPEIPENTYFSAEIKPSDKTITLCSLETNIDENGDEYVAISTFFTKGKFDMDGEKFYFGLEEAESCNVYFEKGVYNYSAQLPMDSTY